MGWIAAVGERRREGIAPVPCVGTPVAAGANLHTAISSTVADTYCLAAGTYELGTTPLSFADGTVIIGQSVTVGLNGAITAPTKIHGTGPAVIRATAGKANLTLENLEIYGATGNIGPDGRGIDGAGAALTNLTVRYCKIHSNTVNGIGGAGRGCRVYNSEIHNNGPSGVAGVDGGIKTTHYAEVYDSYLHDNSYNGMWWDCDTPGGLIQGSRMTGNGRSGVFIEISSGDASSGELLPAWGQFGFRVLNNHVSANNQEGASSHAGINVVSSQNVLINGNVAINDPRVDISVANDGRQNNGHAECVAGFQAANVVVSSNQYGPKPLIGTSLAGTTWTNNTLA